MAVDDWRLLKGRMLMLVPANVKTDKIAAEEMDECQCQFQCQTLTEKFCRIFAMYQFDLLKKFGFFSIIIMDGILLSDTLWILSNKKSLSQ
jgi:hypothetical protein